MRGKINMKIKNIKGRWFLSVAVFVVLLMIIVCIILYNRINTNFENLNNTDQQILSELDKYYKTNSEIQIWQDFHPEKRTILALDGSFGKAFLINPTNEVSSIWATEIKMPEDSFLNVYRISFLTPQLLQFRFWGNFNTIGETYKLFGDEVYYTKYNDSTSIKKEFTSEHFITLLSHESFHYYMQVNWADGSRFSTDLLTDKDAELLRMEYEVLAKIQKALLSSNESGSLLQYTKEYINIVDQRIAENPEYLKEELSMETAEGTATYVGVKASEIVGYDYGVMYFDNVKNISFSEVMPKLDEGFLEKSFLADRMPYETGSLLCLLMDDLNVPNWQKAFNNQTLDKPVTLYSVLKEYIETN